MDKVLFMVSFFIIYIISTWIIYKISGGDELKVFSWIKTTYIFILPISCFEWIFTAIAIDKCISFKNDYCVIFLGNLIIILLTQLVKFSFSKFQKRKSINTTLMYGMSYRPNEYKRYGSVYFEQHIWRLLVFNIVVIPILNIWSTIYFIKSILK